MIIIGLTGSIGMGKSTAAALYRKLGVPVHESDKAVAEFLEPGGKAFETVALAFPDAWDKKTHTINKKKLADLVFTDDMQRQKLESILHPLVRRAQDRFLFKQKRLGRFLAVLDIPLLFETGAQHRVDYVIVVTAQPVIQRQRVLRRPNMTAEKLDSILDVQMPDGLKCNLADYVVQTGLGRADVLRRLKQILKELKRHA